MAMSSRVHLQLILFTEIQKGQNMTSIEILYVYVSTAAGTEL